MAPTHTISAHLCKEIYKSWQTGRQTSRSPEPLSRTGPYAMPPTSINRSPSPDAKRSMDSDRSDSLLSRSPPSSSGWRWSGRQ